jgi:hypothetical protein
VLASSLVGGLALSQEEGQALSQEEGQAEGGETRGSPAPVSPQEADRAAEATPVPAAGSLAALEAEIREEFPTRDDVQQAFRQIAGRFTAYAVRHVTKPDAARARALAAEVLLLGRDRSGARRQWTAMVDLGQRPEDRAWGLFLLGSHRLLTGNYKSAGEAFERVRDEYPKSAWMPSAMRALRYVELQRTRKMPEFSQTFRFGDQELKLTNASLAGKVTMIYFWRATTPKHDEFVEAVARDPQASIDNAAKDFPILEGELVVLGVNLDRDPGVFRAAMKKLAVPWPQVCDGKGFKTPLAEALAIPRSPQWLVVGPRARIWYLGSDVQEFYGLASRAMRFHRVTLEAAQKKAQTPPEKAPEKPPEKKSGE